MKDYTKNKNKNVKESKSEKGIGIWIFGFILLIALWVVSFFIVHWAFASMIMIGTLFLYGIMINLSGVLSVDVEEEKSKEQMIKEIEEKTGISIASIKEEKKMGYEEENDSEDTEDDEDEYDWNDEETIEKAFEGQVNWLTKKGLPVTYLTIHSTLGVFERLRYPEILNFMDKNGYSYVGDIGGTSVLIFKLKGAV